MSVRRPTSPRTRLQWPRILLVAGLPAVVLGALFVRVVPGVWNTADQVVGSVAARMAIGNRPINILLIANNARGVAADQPLGLGTAAGQADVILLAHIDPATHRIDAITVPRDALVAQPGWDDPIPKIKTLFFMGDQETPPQGPQALAKAVSRLTGLPIDGYLVTNFAGFAQAVDAVGGLTIDVKKRIYDPRHSGANFQPGVQHMDGKQVLAFVRVRQNEAGNDYRVNDFQRMQAEVEVLGLLRNAVLNPSKVSAILPQFVARIRKDVATDIPENELVRIGVAMAGAPVYQVPLGTLHDSMWLAPVRVADVNSEGRIWGDYYDVLDPAEIYRRLAPYGSTGSSTGLPPLPTPASVPVALYGSAHLALHLQHLGFQDLSRLGGPTTSGPATVIYPRANPEQGWVVARAMGFGDEQVEPGDVSRVTIYE
ncbi:MAG: LCP family protein [Vulcanimicrobiaceae bacterium]